MVFRCEQSTLARIGVSQQGEERSKCNHFGIERLFLYKKKASCEDMSFSLFDIVDREAL